MVKNSTKNKVIKPLLSVVILVGMDVDQVLLKKCIKSVDWAFEIIQVLTTNIKGSFSEWRNEGLKRAKGDWILYVDSDEEVLPDLRSEINQLISDSLNQYGAFAIPRKNIIFNKEFKYSGQYPDYQKRLFKIEALKKWTGNIHEEPDFVGKLGHLKNPIIHHKDMSIAQMIDKTNKWSEIEADLMITANHPKMNILRFTSVALREFWIKFMSEKAYLDGKEGLIYGIYQIYSRLISYSKLWEKQQSTIHI